VALKRNVLIFHSGALGDFVLSWPLAMAAGRLFAQSRVFYVTSRQKGLLAEKALRLESLDAESGWHTLFADRPNLPDVPSRLLAGAHSVVSFVAEPGSRWESNVRAAAPGAEVLCLAAHPPADFGGHHTDFLLQQLSASVVWQQGVGQMIASLRQRGLGHTPPTAGPVLLHPGSGSRDKCWPLACFTALAGRFRSAGRAVQFAVGEVELERFAPDELSRLRDVADLRTPTTLGELLDLLKSASAFIGNDSGPGHLAGILGVPTVSLFGPTDPARWQPIGPRVAVVRAPSLADITPDAVAAALPPHQA